MEGFTQETITPLGKEIIVASEVNAGHMFYRKMLLETAEHDHLFMKAYDESLFTDPVAADHCLYYLEKEAYVFKTLEQLGYPHLPGNLSWENSALFMEAMTPDAGWEWNLPKDTEKQTQYAEDILAALEELEAYDSSVLPPLERHIAIDEYVKWGWKTLRSEQSRNAVLERLEHFSDQFHPHVQSGVSWLKIMLATNSFQVLDELTMEHASDQRNHIAHFDARQSNIAWHPTEGVKLVDWSWAATAPAGCDRTMFIIDLFKSGYDVSDLVDKHLDKAHAVALMGYWLGRSIAPTPGSDTSVRFHQQAAAASTATLLQNS